MYNKLQYTEEYRMCRRYPIHFKVLDLTAVKIFD